MSFTRLTFVGPLAIPLIAAPESKESTPMAGRRVLTG